MPQTHIKNCLVCNGTGLNALGKKCVQCKGRRPCRYCDGSGERSHYDYNAGIRVKETCNFCRGTGVRKKRCKLCHGTGKDADGNPCPKCGQGSGVSEGSRAKRRPRTDVLIVGELEVARSIEVGEFASELIAALCYRERTGLVEGDWIDDPTRALTDGQCFAEEIRNTTQNTFQVTVSLDISGSMYDERAKIANPLFYAMHQAMKQSQRVLPDGMLIYAPFTFGGESFRTPEAYMPYYRNMRLKGHRGGSSIVWPPYNADYATQAKAAKDEGVEQYEMPTHIRGGGTVMSSLVQAIHKWEQLQPVTASQLTKLDIIITDGMISDPVETSQIQNDRAAGCKLSSIVLNVSGYNSMTERAVPDFMREFPVELESINAQVRNVLMDAIQELLV